MIGSEKVSDYLARLASRQATLGGGAAAALQTAQGAALVAMVARYTSGANYEEHAPAVERITRIADEQIAEALRLADADERACQAVTDSYKHPSSTEELKAARETSVQAARTHAAQVPARLIKVAGTVVDLADELFEIANTNVISDVAAAADAARAAATTARINIDINVMALKTGAVRTQLEQQTSRIEEKVIIKADALSERVRRRILG